MDNKHNSLNLAAKIYSYICPWTLSVPRSSQFSSSFALGKLFANVFFTLVIFSRSFVRDKIYLQSQWFSTSTRLNSLVVLTWRTDRILKPNTKLCLFPSSSLLRTVGPWSTFMYSNTNCTILHVGCCRSFTDTCYCCVFSFRFASFTDPLV